MRKKEIITKLQKENEAVLNYVFEVEANYENLSLYASNIEARVETLEVTIGQLIEMMQEKQ